MEQNNEIIEEIWETRKKIEEENNNDVNLIFERFKSRQNKNPQKYYTGKPLKIRKSKMA